MLAVYRGWMLKPADYQRLELALAERGFRLINNTQAYVQCHHLPNWYPLLESSTPKSVWMPVSHGVALSEVMNLLKPFGTSPVILKDYVKSRKHEWNEACFIPSAADPFAVERVVRRFLELQEDDLNEGLVFRKFVEFEPLATHPISGMPLTREYRLFVLDKVVIFRSEYWSEGQYGTDRLPSERFAEELAAVPSRFFTADIAKVQHGDWLVIELGDGQVSGLPENADPLKFYQSLAAGLIGAG